jgi:hypothetical protein
LLATWLRVTFPAIQTQQPADNVNPPPLPPTAQVNNIRWTRNLMHNLVEECCLTFNDLVAARFDNYHLDFWAAFTTPAGKRNGYLNMIGDVPDLNGEHLYGSLLAVAAGFMPATTTLPTATLNLPLPFFYSRDSGVALPTAALPYNEMRINFTFRNWDHLLIVDNVTAMNAVGSGPVVNPSRCAVLADFNNNQAPSLVNAQVWANYAIVSNDERKRMACAPRDILIEQVQTAPRQNWSPGTGGNTQPSYDIRFSHAIKVLFFAVRNNTTSCNWSNYTTASPVVAWVVGFNPIINFNTFASVDPILQTTLTYENTQRLAQMGSDYFSLVNPWYHAPVIPLETGYHEYSYSLDFICLDPKGSTNYGKLTNVSIIPEASTNAIASATAPAFIVNFPGGNPFTGAQVLSGASWAQTYQFVLTAVNNNIIRISGGALGFPVL